MTLLASGEMTRKPRGETTRKSTWLAWLESHGAARHSIGPVWAGNRGRPKAGSLANTRVSWNLTSRETCNIPAATSAGLATFSPAPTGACRARAQRVRPGTVTVRRETQNPGKF
jgi:hypothetical protein